MCCVEATDIAHHCPLQVEYEGLKHEIKVLEEETALLNSQLEDALRLKDIAESQLEEALDALKMEREQKNSLRKELKHHLSLVEGAFGPGSSSHLCSLAASTSASAASSAPPSGNATPTAATTPGSEDGGGVSGGGGKCSSQLLLQGATGVLLLARANGELRQAAPGGARKAGGGGETTPLTPAAPDLFSELNVTEIHKLKQQLQQVRRMILVWN